MYLWVLKTFRVQRIISTTLPKVFEMHKHNGYETKMKNWRLMWKPYVTIHINLQSL
jgi:hypothetical protein